MKYLIIYALLLPAYLFALPDCVSKKPITEQCLDTLFETEHYAEFLKESEALPINNSEKNVVRKIVAYYSIADYKSLLPLLDLLKKEVRESLFVRNIELRSSSSLKIKDKTLELLKIIEKAYPVFYRNKALVCTEADMILDEAKYDEAATLYDECLKIRKNDIASLKKIEALEKGKGVQEELFPKYLEFLKEYPFAATREIIINKLIFLKKMKNMPQETSPLYKAWFRQMRKSKKADEFYSDALLTIETDADGELVEYLSEKKKYDYALELIERKLNESDKNDEIYKYGWKKYKTLLHSGKQKEAADYLLKLSEQLTGVRKERAEFFAALGYLDSGDTQTAKHMYENIVFSKEKSKYYGLSLYKLGLIYAMEGKSYLAFTLWKNILFSSGIKQTQFFYGIPLWESMNELIALWDKQNGYGIFNASWHSIKKGAKKRSLFYYDFLFSANHGNLLDEKKRSSTSFQKSDAEKWESNVILKKGSLFESMKPKMSSLPKKVKDSEEAIMLYYFAELNIKPGILFYADFVESIGAALAKTGRNKKEIKALFGSQKGKKEKAFVADVLKSRFFEDVYYHTDNTAKRIRYFQAKRSSWMKPAPYLGKDGEKTKWKTEYPAPYFQEIKRLATEYQISPALIYGIMRAETFYRDHLVSPVGAIGIMQVMPNTFSEISRLSGIKITDPYDAYESIKASAWYLDKLLKRFSGNLPLAIAAYNAGPRRVSEWLRSFKGTEASVFIELIPYIETRNYVKKVISYYQIYSYLYEGSFYDVGLGDVINVKENARAVDF